MFDGGFPCEEEIIYTDDDAAVFTAWFILEVLYKKSQNNNE